ncbi:MAG: DUF1707 domain-containing protein [Pseudomonadales bacterium]
MPIRPEDRPIDALREETVDRLIMNYGHGRLSLEAFESRLDHAYAATDHGALTRLTEDLDLEVDAGYLESKRAQLEATGDELGAGETDYLVSVFGGNDRGGVWNVPETLRVISVFGGADIDFTDARFSTRTVNVKLLCVFGGDTIYVPPQVNVTVKAFCVFGGISNRAPGTTDANAPTIVIDGLVFMGGTNIKVRSSVKERLRLFANEFRAMFSESAGTRRD